MGNGKHVKWKACKMGNANVFANLQITIITNLLEILPLIMVEQL